MEESDILITCPKACPQYLAEELVDLGYVVASEEPAGVFVKGTMDDCMDLNLNLRTGLRVLWKLGNFKARNADRFYAQAVKLPWEEWIPSDGYVSIVSSVRNETIRNTQFANLKLKDALVDRMRDKTGDRPNTGNDSDKAMVFLYWHEEEVYIYLDTSGVPLSNRGYRVSPWKAPMRENLAASVLWATQWDGQSALVNPMCGSGTLAIEAALIATSRSPGAWRKNFAFMHLEGFDPDRFEAMQAECREVGEQSLDFPIVASDIDPQAIEAARRNAEIAGVDHLIEFSVCDFRDTRLPEEPGVIVFNPEYGDRLGKEKDLLETYQGIGDFFKQRAAGYWGYVFTGNLQLGKRVGLKTKRKIEFYNGPIECRLLEYELYSGTRDKKKLAEAD